MQSDNHHKKSYAAGFENGLQGKSDHCVYICCENGIHTAFDQIKCGLKTGLKDCLTLIYSTPAFLAQPLFKAELENLERRFPSQLLTHYVYRRNQNCDDDSGLHQSILEIVINSNTSPVMDFMVMGKEDFAGMISGRLTYLGINENQIHTQII
jgi:hypothetical protein